MCASATSQLVNYAGPEHGLPWQHETDRAVRWWAQSPAWPYRHFPGDAQAQLGGYHRLETSPTGSCDVAVLFEGQEHLSGIDANCAAALYVLRAGTGLVPTLLAGTARMVPGCRTGWQSGDSCCPSCAQASSHNGLLEICPFIYSHL